MFYLLLYLFLNTANNIIHISNFICKVIFVNFCLLRIFYIVSKKIKRGDGAPLLLLCKFILLRVNNPEF